MTDLAAALEEARRGLLDLSTRNRLLALPKPGRSRGVLIMEDEDADFVLAELLAGRAFTFEAAPDAAAAPPPAEAPAAAKPRRTRKRSTKTAKAEGVATADTTRSREEAQRDSRLRVRLPAEDLARKLRDLVQDARTAREETGIATLYLALGALAWRDPATPATERLAPLALLPVTLEREGVSQVFRLRASSLEVSENLSLREKLGGEFRVTLPEFDPEAYDPTRWAEAVAQAIGGQGEWRVDADAVALGLFSFAKFLMHADLDPARNPGLLTHPIVRALVGGERLPEAPQAFPDDADIDAEIPVERLDHAMDVDGSQALAAEAVRRGGHLVIQGPPGTGKSQTIATILAQAVLDGRTVLFVAEKLAALEVVKRRLEGLGLGAACLELHSEKQSKRAVLDELRATLALPAPPRADREAVVRRLGSLRGRLNRHAEAMRAPAGASGLPLHVVVGELVGLRARGVAAPDLRLDAGAWDAATIEARRDAVRELAARAAEGGPQSPWRGVGTEIGPAETERLLAGLPALIRSFAAAAATLGPAAAALGRVAGPAGAAALARLAAAVAAAPAHDRAALAHPAWAADPEPLEALLRALGALRAARADARLLPGALDVQGLAEARATLGESGGIFGFLSGTRRAAQALAAQVARDPTDLGALDAALAGQAARARLAEGESLGRGAFGTLWQGEGTDPAALGELLAWRRTHGAEAVRALAAGMPHVDQDAVQDALDAWEVLHGTTALDPAQAFGTAEPAFAALAERLGDWAAAPEGLPLWQGWRRAMAVAEGLAPLVERLADGRIAPEAAPDAFAYALHESLLAAATRARPELAAFDGAAQDRLVEEFREADRARIALTRAEAAAAHAERLKAVRAGAPGYTAIKGEMEKKRGHLPVRALLDRAGTAVQLAKPIFMMSPLSVAQFLTPPHGLRPGLTFDMLVIDEASQIEPVDALGAIARCRQVVVVGDDRQMPPTRFFQRMTSEEGDEPAEEAPEAVAARDVESILGLCNARGVPAAMLRWHYRSRHESLIATSNAEFYENRLLVLPSPRARSPELGLSLVRVAGRWETGAGVNRPEAEAVAEAVLAHAKATPGDTLGVAAFSLRQRDAILDAVEKLRAASPETEAFFTAHEHEPFFVKNLENVQGDERDAMLISVGYGRDGEGKLAMRFGPLSADGGERRLNVLITRAKKRCIVFSGIGAEDIDLARAAGRGVAALKTFLEFAAAGTPARSLVGEAAHAPLGAVIAAAMQDAGKEPVKRVGLSGLFLDVAAREGDRFVLGVEADAGDWAAIRACRDRERGRAAALSQMGWRLARAWSLAWLARPEAERARLLAALGAAPEAPQETAAAPDPGLAEPYAEAALARPEGAIPDVPFATLGALLAEIVGTEGPVHTDAVLERVRLLWGQEALSAADRAALQQGLRLAKQLHGVIDAGGFWTAEGAAIRPRDRRAAAPHLRRAAMVAPAEIEAAATALLGAVPVATEGELAAGIVRLLGLEPGALGAVAARVAALAGAGRIRLAAG